MYQLTKEFTFEAAHKLPHHDGKCARLHGHSFKMRVILKGNTIILTGPKAGMLQDFYDVSQAVKPIVEKFLDHHYLNETTGLENPTSENLAQWIYTHIHPFVYDLFGVEVLETCTSSCLYTAQ